MKQYKYIRCQNIDKYDGWEIVEILPKINDNTCAMAIISKEDKPIQDYIKLHEATNEQLIEELTKRINDK